jgi:preprotein translocase subunit SecA
MIISRETEGAVEKAVIGWAMSEARKLEEGTHYRITADRQLELLPAGSDVVGEPPKGVQPIWFSRRWRNALMQQALTALHLFRRDHQYIIADGKIQIVDESTGRVMPDRSWEQGLHQLIECKEGLELTTGRETIVRMTFQRFFRRYFLLAGLTGTATEAARELWSVYWLKVLRIPPNRPLMRKQLRSCCYANAEQKWERVADEVQAVFERGQPVLVGTRSVEASEALSDVLQKRGVTHVVLNARQDANEADIIKQAGRQGAVTVATNMAGRGTDIKLDPAATAVGGLHVILTEFHFSPRIDRQLFGRSGRQGDPGSARAIVAADDELFRRYAGSLSRLIRMGPESMQQYVLAAIVGLAQHSADRQERGARMQTLRADQTLHRLLGFAGRTL